MNEQKTIKDPFEVQRAVRVYQDTIYNDLDISDEYKAEALKTIHSMLEGNKCDLDAVTIERFEGTLLRFQAENVLTVLKKITKKKTPGRVTGPIKVEDELSAKEAINKEYAKISEDKEMEKLLRDLLMKREDLGFHLDDNLFQVPTFHKEFVVFEPCHTCRTTGTVKCLPCDGKGLDRCPRCSGSGMDYCTHCNGAQMVAGQNNQQIQCPVCHGNGRTVCRSCNQTGTAQCRTCKSIGTTPCPNCNGNAWNSLIFIMQVEVKSAFDYPQKRIRKNISEIIEKEGVKVLEDVNLTISDLQISVVNQDNQKKMQRQQDAQHKKDYMIPVVYTVEVPFGHIEYNINGRGYYSFLFGTQGRFTHVSPFMNDVIKNGKRKLLDAVEGRGSTIENLKMAAEYKTVKEAILFAANYSNNGAKGRLLKKYPFGFSTEVIHEIITAADGALKTITRKPRMIGLGIASIISFGLVPAYFLSPLRSMIMAYSPKTSVDIVIDGAALLLIFYCATLIVQSAAQSAIKSAMAQIIPERTKRSATPKLGNMNYVLAGIISVAALASLEISRHIEVDPIEWYELLFN